MLIRIHPQSSLKRKSSSPQKRAPLPSLASLYHGSHTGRFLCSLVPATTVSPAYPRMSEGREVNKGLEKINTDQEISQLTTRVKAVSLEWKGPSLLYILPDVPVEDACSVTWTALGTTPELGNWPCFQAEPQPGHLCPSLSYLFNCLV